MSNLGPYQVMTTLAKKVGGPKVLLLLTGATGYATGKLGEMAVKRIVRRRRAKADLHRNQTVIEVTSAGTDNSNLHFDVGDSYRILYSDTDMVLVEKIGDTNNPYMVSSDFLRSISNYC